MELKFRTLESREIECRIGQTNDKGFSLLLYKDARVDMALLDEIVGKGYWQREHKILGDDIYCRVGIWNKELNQFVWYEDAGSTGTIEKEKSRASDSFKRACVNVGIGRELYTAPFIWITTTQDNQAGKGFSYSVKSIDYNQNKEISQLTIVNDKTGEIVYSYPKGIKVSQNVAKAPKNDIPSDKGTIAPDDLAIIDAYLTTISGNELKRASFFNWLEKMYGCSVPANLSKEDGKEVAQTLRKGNR